MKRSLTVRPKLRFAGRREWNEQDLMAKPNRPRTIALHAQNPRCHHCGVITEIVPSGYIAGLKDNHATIDHLDTRLQVGYGKPRKYVLSCNKCNVDRNRAESKTFNPAEQAKHAYMVYMGRYYRAVMLATGQVLDIPGLMKRAEEKYEKELTVAQ